MRSDKTIFYTLCTMRPKSNQDRLITAITLSHCHMSPYRINLSKKQQAPLTNFDKLTTCLLLEYTNWEWEYTSYYLNENKSSVKLERIVEGKMPNFIVLVIAVCRINAKLSDLSSHSIIWHNSLFALEYQPHLLFITVLAGGLRSGQKKSMWLIKRKHSKWSPKPETLNCSVLQRGLPVEE